MTFSQKRAGDSTQEMAPSKEHHQEKLQHLVPGGKEGMTQKQSPTVGKVPSVLCGNDLKLFQKAA